MKRIHLVILPLIFLGAGCTQFAPGETTPDHNYLPDHITEITRETLPRALEEAQIRGKQFVTITDPEGNIVRADISSPTHTHYDITLPEETDFLETMSNFKVDIDRAYNYVEEDGMVSFDINRVQVMQRAAMMYEASVRIHDIKDTALWTITIE